VLLVCTVYSVMYSEIAVSRKPFGIGHMYIYTFLLRLTDPMTSQNIDLSSWDILYRKICSSLNVKNKYFMNSLIIFLSKHCSKVLPLFLLHLEPIISFCRWLTGCCLVIRDTTGFPFSIVINPVAGMVLSGSCTLTV
jgi:hypothetical protein